MYSANFGWAKVIEKDLTDTLNQPRFWLELESESRIEIEEPCFVDIF